MIDLTLFPEPWREGWVAVLAAFEGEGLHPRSTLRVGDVLMRRTKTYDEIKASGGAFSWSVYPHPPDYLRVGRDVSIEHLYPDLWGEWNWIEA